LLLNPVNPTSENIKKGKDEKRKDSGSEEFRRRYH
jgi:hypothetical protein